MTKKIIIALLIVAAIIAALPLIGNQGVRSAIDTRLNALADAGIAVSHDDTKSDYLNTSTHYEFKVVDKNKLQSFVNTMSSQQIPPYLTASLDGATIAADVRYSNIPLMSNVEVDIYPVAISNEAQDSLAKDDAALAEQITELIKDKKLFYHLNYAIASGSFSGYLKDVKETINFKDGSKIDFNITKAVFNGEGSLMQPTALVSSIKTVSADVVGSNDGNMHFNLADIHTFSHFKSKNSYNNHIDFDTLELKIVDNNIPSNLSAKEISIDMKSADDGKNIEGNSAVHFKSFAINSSNLKANMQNFVMNFSVKDIDSEAFKTLQEVLESAKNNPSQHSQEQVMQASGALFAKGLTINVDKFSTDKLQYNGSKMMNGFKHSVNVVVKPDPDFAQKLKSMPMAVLQDFDVKAGLHFSKEFYAFINQMSPSTAMASAYAKEDGENVVFDIVLENGALSVNGKSL